MIFNSNLFCNKRILVTGASSGIGRATSILLSQCQAKLVITGRNQLRLNETLAMLNGDDHQSIVCDLNDENNVLAMLEQATISQPLSGIFHAAGAELVRPARMSITKHYDEIFSASVKSALALSRGASMKNIMIDGGAILFMSSVAGQRGNSGMSIYSASKSAIDGLTRSLAVEFAPRKIRVNSIASGAVFTEMHQRLVGYLTDTQAEAYKNKHLLGFGEVLDIAQVAVFLLSQGGAWVTGATWSVDGGAMAR